MSKVLQRAMFKKPQHEHRSTGIASGLKYREGYAVGGRVRLSHGGPPPHPEDQANFPNSIANTASGLESINPDVSMGTNINANVLMTEANRIAKMLSSDIPGIDTAKFALDYDKYTTDYSKYKPSVAEVVGGAAADVIREPIPVEQSQAASFIANLSDRSGNLAETRRELDRLSEEQKSSLALMTDTERQRLQIADATAKREDARAQKEMTLDLFGNLLDKDLAMKDINARITMANNDIQARLDIAGLNAETQIAIQEMIANKTPEKLLIFENLMKPKSEGGMGLSPDAAFATAFGTKDDQLQFAATILNAFSAGAIPGTTDASANITKTISIMEGLFPGTFNITEKELESLIGESGSGSTFGGIKG
tara:strand:+ start:364 stop:1464 length:1101 start_codon:yes stop_codon:yes gene_type:complete